MKELRDLKDLTIHDVQHISDELADYSEVDKLGQRCKSFSFGPVVDSGRVPREQRMLKGHLPRVVYHQVY